MSNVSPINSYAHLSGEAEASPEQGASAPKSTALELPEPEGHNLLEDHNLLAVSQLKLPGPSWRRLEGILELVWKQIWKISNTNNKIN